MDRLVPTLLLVLLVAVLGVGVVVWRGDERTAEGLDRLLCVERAHATATIALLVPAAEADADGRLEAVERLGNAVQAC